MGTPLTGKFTALRTDKAYQTILLLKSIIEPDTPERRLWFDVLARAIMDMDRKDILNSNWFFQSDHFRAICSDLNTHPDQVLKILQKCEIWPPQSARTAKKEDIRYD